VRQRSRGYIRLSLYDAAYLELAQRRMLPLATLDQILRAAARAVGTKTLGEPLAHLDISTDEHTNGHAWSDALHLADRFQRRNDRFDPDAV
jgi:hypothetical protein